MSKKRVQVVLTKDVEDLGRKNQVKTVAAGYARNFLFPKSLAIIANSALLKQVESKQEEIEAGEKAAMATAQEQKKMLESQPIVFSAPATKDGTLFGSISVSDVAKKVSESSDLTVDHASIFISDPMKRTGEYTVSIKLFRSVKARLRVIVKGVLQDTETEPA
jgi:large subunit ribosomal protein L9